MCSRKRSRDTTSATSSTVFSGASCPQAGRLGDRPLWTGSCPCQPFSSAGKQEGFQDERHLWPAFFRLIKECKPPVVFGEQVAAAVGKGWLDIVQGNLEQEGYASGALVFGPHSLGGPHIRQRIYWWGDLAYGRLSHPAGTRLEGSARKGVPEQAGVLLDDERNGGEEGQAGIRPADRGADGRGEGKALSRRSNFWESCEWLPFTDGKRRPVEPGTFPLAARVPQRVGRLRGYGNALCVPVAREFIESYMEATRGKD